jgi:hypothetical protein
VLSWVPRSPDRDKDFSASSCNVRVGGEETPVGPQRSETGKSTQGGQERVGDWMSVGGLYGTAIRGLGTG